MWPHTALDKDVQSLVFIFYLQTVCFTSFFYSASLVQSSYHTPGAICRPSPRRQCFHKARISLAKCVLPRVSTHSWWAANGRACSSRFDRWPRGVDGADRTMSNCNSLPLHHDVVPRRSTWNE